MATKAFLEKAYLAYFGRPVDPAGLTDFAASTDTQVADAFAASAESKALYGTTFDYAQINAIYQALFNRDAEKAGLEYWYAKVADKTFTAAGAAIAILNGAQNADKTAIENKLAASAAFSAALDTAPEMIGYSGAAAAASARAFLSSVTTTAATAAAVDAAVASAVASKTAVSGQTFTLTTSVDTLTGGASNDTFIADNTGTDVTSTADKVNGGNGTDTLNMFSDGAQAAMPALTSIEILNVYDQNATLDVSSSSSSSVTEVNLLRGDGGILTVGANVTTVGLSDIVIGGVAGTTDDVVVNYAATLASGTLNLSGTSTKAAAADENIEVNGTVLKTLIVNVAAASSVDVLDVDAVTALTINATGAFTATSVGTTGTATMNITGAGAVSVGTLDADINTITSTGSGALTAAIGANTDTVLTGGSGNDVITASTTDTIATAEKLKVDAGTGTADVLEIAETVDVDTAADAARYVGFDVIRSGDSVDMSLVAGITALQVAAATDETFSKMTSTMAANTTLRGTQTTNVTFGVNSATDVGQIDTLALSINDGATAVNTITAANLTAAGVENITIAATDNFTATILTGLTAMTNLTVTGSGNVSLTTSTLAFNVNTIIDASAATGTFLLAATDAATNGASIKGSATKANTITGSAQADIIVGGTGVDTVISNGAGADTLNFVSDDAADIFEIVGLTGKTTITNFDAATTTTTEDLVNVSANTVDDGEVVVTAAGSATQTAITTDRTYVIEQAIGGVGSLTVGSATTLVLADFTATTLTNIAAFLSERYKDVTGTTTATEAVLFVVNNGTNSYAYSFADTATANTTIDANELTLVGVFNGVILNSGDVYQTA